MYVEGEEQELQEENSVIEEQESIATAMPPHKHSSCIIEESDESVVNKWFNDVCRTVLLQEMEDQDYGLENQDDVILVNDREDGTDK